MCACVCLLCAWTAAFDGSQLLCKLQANAALEDAGMQPPFKRLQGGSSSELRNLLERQFKREIIAILESSLVWNLVPIVWSYYCG